MKSLSGKQSSSLADMKEVRKKYWDDDTSIFNEAQLQEKHFFEYGGYDNFLQIWKKKIDDFIALKRRFWGYYDKNCTKGKVTKVLFGEFTDKGDAVTCGLMENTGVDDWIDYKKIIDDPDIKT